MKIVKKIKQFYWQIKELSRAVYNIKDDMSYLKRLMFYKENRMPFELFDWLGKDRIIAHAMGAIDGVTYTNSLEAFKESYSRGIRVFEVDICLTEEKIPVLCHEWGPYNNGNLVEWDTYWKNVETYTDAPSKYGDFVQTKILGKYTTLTLFDLVKISEQYEDVKFIVSAKSRSWEYDNEAKLILITLNELIHSSMYNIADKFIVQVHSKLYFECICQDCNFKHFVLGLRPGKMTDDEIKNMIHETGIKNVLVKSETCDSQIVKDLLENNIRVIAYTVNDIEVYHVLSKKGIKGVLTDRLNLKQIYDK